MSACCWTIEVMSHNSKRIKKKSFFFFLQLNCPFRIFPKGYSGFFPWGKPAVTVALPNLCSHAGCLSVSIIHPTLTWTTGSLTCTQMWMHATEHKQHVDTVKESALKVDSGRKIPCRTGESNQRRRRAGPTLYQLSYIPTHTLRVCDCVSARVVWPTPTDGPTHSGRKGESERAEWQILEPSKTVIQSLQSTQQMKWPELNRSITGGMIKPRRLLQHYCRSSIRYLSSVKSLRTRQGSPRAHLHAVGILRFMFLT